MIINMQARDSMNMLRAHQQIARNPAPCAMAGADHGDANSLAISLRARQVVRQPAREQVARDREHSGPAEIVPACLRPRSKRRAAKLHSRCRSRLRDQTHRRPRSETGSRALPYRSGRQIWPACRLVLAARRSPARWYERVRRCSGAAPGTSTMMATPTMTMVTSPAPTTSGKQRPQQQQQGAHRIADTKDAHGTRKRSWAKTDSLTDGHGTQRRHRHPQCGTGAAMQSGPP